MRISDELTHALAECIAATEFSMSKCLKLVNPGEVRDCIQAQWDCATICASTLQLLSRGSKNAQALLEECIEICKECEELCNEVNLGHLKMCAETCRNCYMICEQHIGFARVA